MEFKLKEEESRFYDGFDAHEMTIYKTVKRE